MPNGLSGAAPVPGVMARDLDPDLSPWERQPEEPQDAYDLFLRYRDMDKRVVVQVAEDETRSRLLRLSAVWSWGYRAYEWDKHMHRAEVKELVRYRRTMNERQRTTARAAQNKIAQWLVNLDVSRLKPMEAAKWYELAVKVEREAAGATSEDAQVMPEAIDDEDTPDQTLADMVGVTPEMEHRAAQILFEMSQINPETPTPQSE